MSATADAILRKRPLIYLPMNDPYGHNDLAQLHAASTPQGGLRPGASMDQAVVDEKGSTEFDGSDDDLLTPNSTRRNWSRRPRSLWSKVYDSGVATAVIDSNGPNHWANHCIVTHSAAGQCNFSGYPIGSSTAEFPAAPGDVFTAKIDRLVCHQATGGINNVTIGFDWFSNVGGYLGGSYVQQPTTKAAVNALQGVAFTSAPAVASTAYADLVIAPSLSGAGTWELEWERTIVERGSSVSSWFDGSGYIDNATGAYVASPDVHGNRRTGWLGTAQDSYSDRGAWANGTVRTFMWWQKRRTDAGRDCVFGGTHTGSGGIPLIEFETVGNGNVLTLQMNGTDYVAWGGSPAVPVLGAWEFYTVVFDEPNDRAYAYKNGANLGAPTQQGSAAAAGQFPGPHDTYGCALEVGLRGTAGVSASDYFDGRIAHAAVFERGLSL